MIRTIEELSMNAWPAVQTILYDGWVLRFANGYTRRANSAVALYPSLYQPVDTIRHCESLYQAKGLPVIIKLPGRQESIDLDGLLSERGYIAEAETSVQTLSLSDFAMGREKPVSLSEECSEAWLRAFSRLSGLRKEQEKAHRQILGAILVETCFAAILVDDRITACGLGVYQGGFLGIYDVVVDTGCRRRGYGECLVQGILAWGKDQGAHTAYLQVMRNNPPALALYIKLGFREAYQYWYRVKR